MKRILSLILVFTLVLVSIFAVTSCKKDDSKIRIGYLTGPTGMGMAKLIADNGGVDGNEKYIFEKFTSPALAKDALAGGKVDMICYPTNEAAEYYANVNDNVTVLAINTIGSLYLITDKNTTISSFEELEGKTVYVPKAGTPRLVLNYLLSLYDIDANVSYTYGGKDMNSPQDLKTNVVAGNLEIAVAPEPIVTASTLGNTDYSVDLNLSDVWDAKIDTPLTMGCIVANKDFVSEHKGIVKDFLNEYKASISYISSSENVDTSATLIKDAGVMEAAPAAKKALLNLGDSIAYLDGNEMKAALENFYTALNITKPEDDFYAK